MEQKVCQVLGADEETTNHLQWQKIPWLWQILWRSFLESLYVDTTQIRNKWDCWKSSAQSKRRHLCNIVAIRSGWKLVGRFHGMQNLSAKCSRSLVWWEDPYERRFGKLFKGPSIPFGSLVEYYPISVKDPVKKPPIWKESITWIVPRIRFCTEVEFGRVTCWLQTLRSWTRWTHQKSKRLSAKEIIFSQRKWKIPFPSRSWTNQSFWKRSRPENIHLGTASTNSRRKSHRFSWRIRRVSSTTSFPNAGEAINDFWSMSGNFIFRHHVEPRVKLYSPREETFPIPLKYIDVSRTTKTNMDVKQERRIDDYWNVDGSRDLSDPWTGFTQFTLLEEKPPDGYVWSGERLTGKQLTSRPDRLWPELWIKLGRDAKLKERQKGSIEKTKVR